MFLFDKADEIVDKSKVRAAKDAISHLLMREDFGWKEGYRNSIAVDYCCACWLLDEDPEIEFEQIKDFIKHADSEDQFLDPEGRIESIVPYKDAWKGKYVEKSLNLFEWEKYL